MEAYAGLLVLAVLVAVAFVVVPRMMGSGGVTCNRCDGTGQINERWPDPSQPGGFHVATGKCPKCKGKGRIRM